MNKSIVYFTNNITSEGLIKIYEKLGKKLEGHVAIKISTGEKGGHNFLSPDLIKGLVEKLDGTIVECNTAYKGKRYETKEHLETIKHHGFSDIAKIDILDQDGEIALDVMGGKHLNVNYVGKNIENYDSMLVLSHFKGHVMGGFGGALKNESIGLASKEGKCYIHTAGKVKDVDLMFDNFAKQEDFLESMAEACMSVIDYMDNKIVYINVMNKISVDCDCNANPKDPCMEDIGILASVDPVALDKACVDLIYHSNDNGRFELIERMEKQKAHHLLDYAEMIKLGSKEYKLVDID